MNVVGWLKSGFSTRRKALWSYRRGMARAKRCDYEGTLANYTAAIELVGVPADAKTMALYNRVLAYVAAGDDAKGVDDLNAVLAMDGTMVIVNIMTMAKQKLAKMESRTRRSKV
jgi:hypothetical protein